MRCNQCDSLYINDVFCHETGCPNTHKVYDSEEKQWVTPEQEEPEDDYYFDIEEAEEERLEARAEHYRGRKGRSFYENEV